MLRRSFLLEVLNMTMTGSMQTWIWIALAGAVGTLCRYAVGRWVLNMTGGTLPWGTFAVNMIGCLLIGIVAGSIEKQVLVSPMLRLAIIVGFLGGFTTFSSFALEGYALTHTHDWLAAGGYIVLTNVIGLGAVWAGHRLVA
jgi:CrcB protein